MMLRSTIILSGFIISALLISGCASNKIVKKENYSGYLADYSQLKPVELESNRMVLRWVSPNLKRSDYNAIVIEPTGYFQDSKEQKQVDGNVMLGIQERLSSRISKLAKSSNLNLVQKNGPKTLRLQSTIAAIKFSEQGFSAKELIPLKLVLSAIEAAAGGRDYEVTVFFEYRLLDSVSNEVMSSGVRQGKANTLSNSETKLSLNDLDDLLDRWEQDWANGFQSDFFNLTERLKNK